ncbi:MAG: helicase-exonuclease AddAB subunit AddA [Clostridiales bacterium]|nr:helicase-exonuclease AddAB subunit AddA [Clostridiales bacterium]
MPEITFTQEQLMAIQTQGKDILVAAAAGSGKTAVLVERIINIITNAEKPIDIDRLLVVTFTEAAANEMKQRIQAAVTKLLEQNPEDEHLQKQSNLISRAGISTIHSFCLGVIRQNFHVLDIDPSFRIADQVEIQLLKHQVIGALFEEEYSDEGNELFLGLVESFGDKVHDDKLAELVLKIHNFAESNPWPESFILSAAEKFGLPDSGTIDETVWAGVIKGDILNALNYMLIRLGAMEKIAGQSGGPTAYLDNIIDDRLVIEALIKYTEESLVKLYNNLGSISFGRLKTIKKADKGSVDPELKDRFQKIRNKDIKDGANSIKKNYFFKSPEKMVSDLRNFSPIIKYLGEIVIKFSRAFVQAKREKNIVDFNDLEHFCLQVLLDGGADGAVPSKYATELQDKYHEVLVDEYQDSNLAQEIILSAVSKKAPGNRFMVGDIKQGIYRFRHARPEIFIDKYNSFSRGPNAPDLKIDLAKNFRSRKSVISSINYLFYQIMTDSVGEITYNSSQALYTDDIGNEAQSTEIILIEQGLENFDSPDEIQELHKTELEAHIISKKILALKESLYITEKGNNRLVEFSDIVILVRSISTIAETFVEVMKQYGIPVYASSEGGFFNSVEVLTMISFLQIIDNPQQDIHLITVLHSPVYNLSAEELLEIRGMGAKLSFYNAARLFMAEHTTGPLPEKLSKFFEDLGRWRGIATFIPINELVFKVFDESFYYNYVGVMQGGNIRQANLRALQEKAVEFEGTSFKSLFHFIKYIERVQKIKLDNGNAQVISENENLVKLMTIHKSKGLEYPVVFVSMMGKGFNLRDEKQSLLIHNGLGFGPMYVDLGERVRSNTLARLAVSKKIHKESISEEIRILYVALTRAKEKLILTGVVSNLSDKLQAYREFEDYDKMNLPPYYILKAKNYLDFCMPAILRHKGFNNAATYNEEVFNFDTKFEISFCEHSDVLTGKKEGQLLAAELYARLQGLDLDGNGYKTEIEKGLSWEYKYSMEKSLPTKVNITEIKRAVYQDESDTELVFAPPVFIKAEEGLSGTQYGILVHSILEHLDLNEHNSYEKIKGLINSLVEKNILSAKEAAYAPVKKILKYVKSGLADRARKSPYIKKETPFVLGVLPSEVYPFAEGVNEKILVHGIIDCFFEEKGKLAIIDFKTDYVNNVDEIVERYRVQLSVYKKALERSTNKVVAEAILYLFAVDNYVILSYTDGDVQGL